MGTALPKEQARVRVVLGHYKEIGPAGMFGAALIEESLRRADIAVMSGDVVELANLINDHSCCGEVLAAAVLAEREACANVYDSQVDANKNLDGCTAMSADIAIEKCVEAIRDRKD